MMDFLGCIAIYVIADLWPLKRFASIIFLEAYTSNFRSRNGFSLGSSGKGVSLDLI